MKKVSVFCLVGIGLLFGHVILFAQQASSQPQSIPSRSLQIAYAKTSNIVFPFAIKSVDRGSKDVLVQKAGGIENVLQLKAAKEGFEETNLTVVTADGKLYSFTVNYDSNPSVLNLLLDESSPEEMTVKFSSEVINDAQSRFDAGLVASIKRKMMHKKDHKSGILLELNGLYVNGNVMYFRLEINNNTHIGYDIDQIRFFIRDQKKVIRTASQEVEVKPVFIEGGTDHITGKTGKVLVFVLPKITIADKKYLAVQLMEKNGGRHLGLKLGNRSIMKARPVDSLY